ncbi:MAG: FAD-binding protein, partial [Candidatus Limnocylindrales bacterium]
MAVDTGAAPATIAPDVLESLHTTVRGRIVTPGDADYDAMRGIVYGGFDPRPAAIVRVLDAADIAAVVRIAATTGIPLAVRGGGHSNAGHSSVDHGLVIDLREMHTIEIDPVTRTAWAQAGATAAELTQAAGEHGLV